MTHGIRVVSMVAAVVALNQIPGVGPRPREADRQLYITTDRLSYRLTQNGRVWAGGMVVRLTNYTNDTIYLRPACGHRAPEHQFAPIVGDFFYPPYERPAGCPVVAASGVSLNLEARKPAFAIAGHTTIRCGSRQRRTSDPTRAHHVKASRDISCATRHT